MKGIGKIFKTYHFPLAMLIIGLGLFAASFGVKTASTNADGVARKAERKIERRVRKLDSYAKLVSGPDASLWDELDKLPEDMVIYRYVDDTLQCWGHQFPVANDDIRARMRYQRLARPEFELSSPLNRIGEELSFVNLGPKWYLAKWTGKGEITEVLAAIEVCTSYEEGTTENINRKIGISDDFVIYPVAGNAGATVSYDGHPLFSIVSEPSTQTFLFANSILRWLGLLAIVIAALMLLGIRHRWSDFGITACVLVCSYFLALVWSHQEEASSMLFSPSLYAGEGIWSSFGALMALNTLLFCLALSIFMMRHAMLDLAEKYRKKGGVVVYTILITLAVAGIAVYTAFSIRDLMLNSNITLELQWFRSGMGYSAAAVAAYGLLLLAMMMLLYMLSPVIAHITNRKIRFFTLTSLSIGTLLFTLMVFTVSTKMGFDKERSRVSVWANRLAVDRNLSLELQIRSVEEAIANDSFIPTFADLDDAASMIGAEVTEQYFRNIASDYYVQVSVCNNDDMACNALFNSKLIGGTQIAPGSRFFCNYDNNGRSSYAGTFMYMSRGGNLVRMLVEIISRASKEDNGYYSIFDMLSKPGDVMMPEIYSYAKFIDGKLASYRGSYAYPTILSAEFSGNGDGNKGYFKENGYIHFINNVSDNEVVIVSRRSRALLAVITSLLTIYATIFIILTPLLRYGKRKEKNGNKSFRKRMQWTLIVTVSIALAALAAVSVKFVFDRNKVDSMTVMSEKISAVQTIVESRCNGVNDLREVEKTEWMSMIQDVASTTRTDISMFTPKGDIFVSTVAEMYDLALLSYRIDGQAYHEIMENHQRMCIHKEETDGRKYFALYAPVFNTKGETMAIICTPFNRNAEIMREAIPHAVLLVILLVTIIIISSVVATHIIDRIFQPLSQLSRKMEAAGTKGLEYIEYNHDDELTGVVNSYNQMVHDLEESSRLLAQNERDKAWSAMARQVAHEIKNPLTPINLEIQKLMLLKQRNDPRWSEKFDSSARIILEHISILSDTANEFSTFAKLYTENPVEMNLDQMLSDQVMLFNNKENIDMTYLGLEGATLLGPKPQLIRVFVNLLTNAVQAIEIMQRAQEMAGEEVRHGQIRVELRNDITANCYEIAVDDNGPGVPEENKDKVFLPNFTTKNGGSGLGLAICHSIVEKCNGTITYKKSFSLEGACFTVRLPKTQPKENA